MFIFMIKLCQKAKLKSWQVNAKLPLPIHCLFVLMLEVSVNNFSVMSGQSHHFLGITSTFRAVNVSFTQGHNTAEVGIEPLTSRSGIRDMPSLGMESETLLFHRTEGSAEVKTGYVVAIPGPRRLGFQITVT